MPIHVALSLACLLIGGLLTGCEAGPPVPQKVDANATPAGGLAEPLGSDEQLSLDDRLTCQEAELFKQPPWVQAAWLAHGSVLSCDVDPGSPLPPSSTGAGVSTDEGEPPQPAATCTGNGGLRLFGLPVIAVRVAASGEPVQGLQIDLQAGVEELAAAAGDALGMELLARQPNPLLGDSPGYQATDEDGRVYYVSARAADPGRDDPGLRDTAQTGASRTDPRAAEMATFGCLAPRAANQIKGS